jgi:hypothetical protein
MDNSLILTTRADRCQWLKCEILRYVVEVCVANVHVERPNGPANPQDLRPTGIAGCVGNNKFPIEKCTENWSPPTSLGIRDVAVRKAGPFPAYCASEK